jgi:hypothetical protein
MRRKVKFKMAIPVSKVCTCKEGGVRSLAFLGQAEVPKANTKTRPPDL